MAGDPIGVKVFPVRLCLAGTVRSILRPDTGPVFNVFPMPDLASVGTVQHFGANFLPQGEPCLVLERPVRIVPLLRAMQQVAAVVADACRPNRLELAIRVAALHAL